MNCMIFEGRHPGYVKKLFIMRNNLKICHKVQLKSEKEIEGFKMREEHHVRGTPRIAVDHYENNLLTLWTEDLRRDCLSQLKDHYSTQKAFEWARVILEACLTLTPIYGFFIINQNMVFMNKEKEISVWINPNIFENKVKIYLPPTSQGETTMIRSIVSFFKLWLRCDFTKLSEATHLYELSDRLQPCKLRSFQLFKPRLPVEIQAERRNSVNTFETKVKRRFQTTKFPPAKKAEQNLSSRFSKKRPLSPGQESQSTRFITANCSLTNKDNIPKFSRFDSEKDPKKNKTTLVSQKIDNNDHFQSRTFNNAMNNINHLNQTKTTVNTSLGGLSSYFPNRTTSNRNHIVRMILQFDNDPHCFGKNNLLLDQDKLRELERQKLKKLKQSLHGIGQQLNDLFQSNLFNSEEFTLKDISTEFQHLLE